jgi:hypothetical protein
MFDHRLGSLLRRSLGEVHALSYPEYRSWQLFYLLEPWGWENEEINTVRIIAMIHNAASQTAKAPSEFLRDPLNEILNQLKEKSNLEDLPLEERRKKILQAVKQDFRIK